MNLKNQKPSLNISLSPQEFETLAADVVGAVHNVHFERFGEGADGGMDGRVCLSGAKKWIVQAKRYKSNSALLRQLKEEKIKMHRVLPQRYFLVCASSLNPDIKQKILETMSPYILSTADIYGADDLEVLLDKYPSIYKKHYKLWLGSARELSFIKNNEHYNRAENELHKISTELIHFVAHKEVLKATEILEKSHYILITGDPGVGKSITAGHLAFEYYLAKQPYEFHYIRDRKLEDVISLIQKGVKQVFMLDDFLGASFLHTENLLSTTSDFITLVNIAKKSEGEIKLIFTSRDYIIAQLYSQVDEEDILKALLLRTTVTIDLLEPLFRARLVHRYFTNTKLSQIKYDNFIENKTYQNIINHKNFNPRFLKQMFYTMEYIEEPNISKWCIEQLNDPIKIWQKAFKKLSDEAKVILYLLSLVDGEVLSENLKDEYEMLFHKLHNAISVGFEFDSALDELEPNFINSFYKGEFVCFSIANGGIRDFLHNTIASSKLMTNAILESFEHFNFGAEVFGFSQKDKKPIILTESQKEFLCKKLLRLLENSIDKISNRDTLDKNNNIVWKKQKDGLGKNITMLWQLVKNDNISAQYVLKEVENKLQDEKFLLNIIKKEEMTSLVELFRKMTPSFQSLVYTKLIQNIINSQDAATIAKEYTKNKILKNIVDKKRNKLIRKMENICEDEIERASNEGHIQAVVEDIYQIEEVFSMFDVPSYIYLEKLNDMHQGEYDYDVEDSAQYWQVANPNEKWDEFLEKSRIKIKEIDTIFKEELKQTEKQI